MTPGRRRKSSKPHKEPPVVFRTPASPPKRISTSSKLEKDKTDPQKRDWAAACKGLKELLMKEKQRVLISHAKKDDIRQKIELVGGTKGLNDAELTSAKYATIKKRLDGMTKIQTDGNTFLTKREFRFRHQVSELRAAEHSLNAQMIQSEKQAEIKGSLKKIELKSFRKKMLVKQRKCAQSTADYEDLLKEKEMLSAQLREMKHKVDIKSKELALSLSRNCQAKEKAEESKKRLEKKKEVLLTMRAKDLERMKSPNMPIREHGQHLEKLYKQAEKTCKMTEKKMEMLLRYEMESSIKLAGMTQQIDSLTMSEENNIQP